MDVIVIRDTFLLYDKSLDFVSKAFSVLFFLQRVFMRPECHLQRKTRAEIEMGLYNVRPGREWLHH